MAESLPLSPIPSIYVPIPKILMIKSARKDRTPISDFWTTILLVTEKRVKLNQGVDNILLEPKKKESDLL